MNSNNELLIFLFHVITFSHFYVSNLICLNENLFTNGIILELLNKGLLLLLIIIELSILSYHNIL